MPKQKQKETHIPVLLKEVLHYLSPQAGQSYLDVTAGYGGHAQAILDITGNHDDAVLVDRDEQAIKALRGLLGQNGPTIIHADFLNASKSLAEEGKQFDMILADLGVSSPHLNESSRGFAIRETGPLDMRMDTRQELTAEKIVNTYDEETISKILSEYGEEPKARQIAKRIVRNRPLKTTVQLAEIVAKSWPGKSRVHPATRTFQALRIAVNSELSQLEEALPVWTKLLAPEGRLAVISFHSLEDRKVKQYFSEYAANTYDAELTLLTRKPVTASPDEIASNPRARSARLRACSKNKNISLGQKSQGR
jgi:16S rRNA (cytosine1402-N4)-methyltransferase